MYTEGDKENAQPRKRIVSSSQGGGVDRERHKQQASPFFLYPPSLLVKLILRSNYSQLEELKVRMQGIHEKEISKLLTEVTKLETGREESLRDKNEFGKEIIGLKSEIRQLLPL